MDQVAPAVPIPVWVTDTVVSLASWAAIDKIEIGPTFNTGERQ